MYLRKSDKSPLAYTDVISLKPEPNFQKANGISASKLRTGSRWRET